jgi:hypothetical protein
MPSFNARSLAGVLLGLFALTVVENAVAEERRGVIACRPTMEAKDKCVSAGGRFDFLHCRCVGPQPEHTGVCSLVCFDGALDAKRCRCIHPK